MNYQKIYNSLIEKRRISIINNNVHYHHIIPICCNGENTKRNAKYNCTGTNLVGLTIREHFVAHWLLTKIYKDTQFEDALNYAFLCMCNFYQIRLNSHTYEKLMSKVSLQMSKNRKGRIWVTNGKINKYIFIENIEHGFYIGRIQSDKQKHINKGVIYITNGIINKTILPNDDIPNGWHKGRTLSEKEQKLKTKQKGKIFVNNGIKDIMVDPDKIPKGFVKGKIKRQTRFKKHLKMQGKIWINNGQINKRIYANDVLPAGFVKGRIQTEAMLKGYFKSGFKR